MHPYRFYKNRGETPLEALNRFKNLNPALEINKLTSAGRLDPMARGYMAVLINEDCKNCRNMEAKNKEYKFKFVVGIDTDTTDMLGIFQNMNFNYDVQDIYKYINEHNQFSYDQEFHAFSSYRVIGPEGKKGLWYYSMKNIYVKAPTKKVNIWDFEIIEESIIDSEDLKEYIFENINKIINKEFFRYDEIYKNWNIFFNNKNINKKFIIFKCKAKVSSGTYIRQLVKDIGKIINVPLCVVDINRTDIFI